MAKIVCGLDTRLGLLDSALCMPCSSDFDADLCKESLDRRADVVVDSTSSSDATRSQPDALSRSCHQFIIQVYDDEDKQLLLFVGARKQRLLSFLL